MTGKWRDTIRACLLPLVALVLLAAAPAAVEYQETTASVAGQEARAPDEHQEHTAAMTALGEIDFPVSCADGTREAFNRGVGLLHHMMYLQAEQVFAEVAVADPSCAMAHWGIAMTLFHPVWAGQPTADDLERGRAAIELAASLGAPTERENAYIAATSAFYASPDADYRSRLETFRDEIQRIYSSYPEDIDAASLYALMLIATAPATDKTLTQQREAVAILEQVRRVAPTHPGAIHYAIHAHDVPMLASQAEEIARSYDQIAPDVPHALHMPSHIFVRLGHWPDVISWNRRSAQAAIDLEGAATLSNHFPHASDYLVYAHLQRADDDAAKAALEDALSRTNYRYDFGTVYALTAIPARYSLERREWAEAASLAPRIPAQIAWDDFPEVEAITHFARSLGAARSGDADAARTALGDFEAVHARTSGYWASRLEAQKHALQAWINLAEGDADAALAAMNRAVEVEFSTEKHPVTPGEVLPAAELLGDMLLELDRPQEAVAAYERSLEQAPNRLNSLAGALDAAQAANDVGAIARYSRRLAEVIDGVQSERARSLRASMAVAMPFDE